MTELLQRISIVVAAIILTACGGGGDDDPVAPPVTDPFTEVDDAARSAFEQYELTGMGLAIYRTDGTRVFEKMYGAFSADQQVAIFSASKLVAGVTIFRLIDQGYLSLDSTTGTVLGWTGESASISLRQLLSFTSGLPPENVCTYRAAIMLAECVEQLAMQPLRAAPGTRFDYGSTHLAVAGRMAEVVTGENWNAIFEHQLRAPLGLPAGMTFFTSPLSSNGTSNPLLAGGLRASMDDYARILHFVYHKGVWDGAPLMAPEIFDTQTVAPYPNAVIGSTPAQYPDARYGLTAWLECDTPATGCASISSPGAYGFTPWLDRDNGYYAILGMEYPDNSETGFGSSLERQLKPLIVDALAKIPAG